MADFNGISKEAIDGGESLESAMRKAASLAAKQTVESLPRSEIGATLGYDRHDPSGKNSGDSRNGTYERTLQTSFGPISAEVPRDRNGECKRSPSQGTNGGILKLNYASDKIGLFWM